MLAQSMVRGMFSLCTPAHFLRSVLDTVPSSRQQTVHRMLALLFASAINQGGHEPGIAGSVQVELSRFAADTCIMPEEHCCCKCRILEGECDRQWRAAA